MVSRPFEFAGMAEDGALEVAKLRPRFEAEFRRQQPSTRLVDLECVRMAAAAVESEHELAPETLAKRVLGDQPLKVRKHLAMARELELHLDTVLERGQPQLLEPRDLGLSERVVCNIQKGRPSPQSEGLFERRVGRFP